MIIKVVNYGLALPLAIAELTLNSAQAVEVKSSNSVLQGGSDSSVTWEAPAIHAFKVYVRVPATSTATNALYRVYPKAKSATSSDCLSTDPDHPCFEIPIDTSKHPGEWVQLMLAGDPATQWDFVKGSYATGIVTVNAGNLAASEILATGSALFDNPMIGQALQGGIVISIDYTGRHGLIAANQDLPNKYDFFQAKDAVKDSANYDAEGQKYTDWRVPGKNELNVVYQHKDLLSATEMFYWSSSSTSKTQAWLQLFTVPDSPDYNGFQGSDGTKTFPVSVRPVRSF